METAAAFWHIANFFAPALVVALIASAVTKFAWRRELAAVGWLRLAAWPGASMAAVSIIGLVLFEHDGKMITYAAMVIACVVALWWAGFRRSSR